MTSSDLPEAIGLYQSDFEHDACGVGFICSIHAIHSHYIVETGLSILERLDHRGATGSDPDTGDGAGILSHIPDALFQTHWRSKGMALPAFGDYAVGNVFLSRDETICKIEQQRIETLASEEGQRVLGWRKVPVDNRAIGTYARSFEPQIWQIFLGKSPDVSESDYNRMLFVLRKRIEADLGGGRTEEACHDVYVTSLSSKTIVYKGMLTPSQLGAYYIDLKDPLYKSAIAMVHSRFSTNTLPAWSLAQPFRAISHNGEINTLRGNINWMRARQGQFSSPDFGDDIEKIVPIFTDGGSDSQAFDNALEVLCQSGRSLPRAVMMMIPEAWEHNDQMDAERRAFYDYHSCLIEPWDGPATVPFTDGRYIGAVLDRNGLRPSRYTVTHDGFVVLASETGVVDFEEENIAEKGRLQPGKMFLVDLKEQRIISDEEVKREMASSQPYGDWLEKNMLRVKELPISEKKQSQLSVLRKYHKADCHHDASMHLFGYTREDLEILLPPMFLTGKEALGSMGDDTPLAVLSERPRLLYDYFKQLFAQVTNPPLDAIREQVVTSLYSTLGAEGNLFDKELLQRRLLRLDQPILGNDELLRIRVSDDAHLQSSTFSATFDLERGGEGLRSALLELCTRVHHAVEKGCTIVVLSDYQALNGDAPIPALLATAAVHHHLIRAGLRTRCSLVVESGEAREVHHMATLIGFGADAINPYVALQLIPRLLEGHAEAGISDDDAIANYIKAIGKGLLKIMSKMGISTIQSYRGAQIFEAVGISPEIVDAYFTSTPTRIQGITLDVLVEEIKARFLRARREFGSTSPIELDQGGRYQWRRNGEHHSYNPDTVASLQHAVRQGSERSYEAYARLVNKQNKQRGTLRGLMSLRSDVSVIPLDEVEPWTEIVKRFKTGAMSYGSISSEAHESLAIAMNTLGGKSNTGEGGEAEERYEKGNPRRSRIKQVASGRFGVTAAYLASADEIQIKMAQGAKPGEGGQLPAPKVYPWVAKVRHATPYVGLISPPPHHDIYSIEDLAQLIFDLKNVNPSARISVKLVSEMGVGTIAAGVAKGKADVILISGSDGGTGASPQTSIMHAGLPWELGLSETHQTLVLNGLRNRVRIECDGQLKTGLDVAKACLLGAEEFGFATAPLIAMGCIMMRKCHLNSCPVGIATQDPVLREKFAGEPEHVVNYFHFVAEELRTIMASLGLRTIDEMIGRVDLLEMEEHPYRWKAKYVDLSAVVEKVHTPEHLLQYDVNQQVHDIDQVKDRFLIAKSQPAIADYKPVEIHTSINNADRAFGTMLSGEVASHHGTQGLPEDTIVIHSKGSAGQSLGAFGAPGISIHVVGDANDYFGKGLSGAKLTLRPPEKSTFKAAENIIVGNVALYGATSGRAFINGRAGERFAVRNSGASAVVEGVGDHGCEYMTGGRIVILGETGRNFGAGMSGGIAYVYDERGDFAETRCNMEMVEIEALIDEEERKEVAILVEEHYTYTRSAKAKALLCDWKTAVQKFAKVIPTEYKRALQRQENTTLFSNMPSHLAA